MNRRVRQETKSSKIRILFFIVLGLATISFAAGNMTWVTFYLIHRKLSYLESLSIGTLLALIDFVTTFVNKRRVIFFNRTGRESQSDTYRIGIQSA